MVNATIKLKKSHKKGMSFKSTCEEGFNMSGSIISTRSP